MYLVKDLFIIESPFGWVFRSANSGYSGDLAIFGSCAEHGLSDPGGYAFSDGSMDRRPHPRFHTGVGKGGPCGRWLELPRQDFAFRRLYSEIFGSDV